VSSPEVPDSPSAGAATVCEAFQRLVAASPEKVALRTRDGWALNWAELDGRIRSIAAGLATLGIGRGDTVAILLPNTPENHMVDFAAIHLGGVPFTIYNTSTADQIVEHLDMGDATVLVTESSFLETVGKARQGLPLLEHVIVTDADEAVSPATMSLAQLEAGGDPGFDFDAAWRAVEADDLVTLIFTSGTTGPPKGVHWSHRTVLAQQRDLGSVVPLARDGVVSFLPLAHAGGRITSHYVALLYGATITCCPVIMDFPAYLAEVHPDALFLPPRMWEKLQVAIENLIDELPSAERDEAKVAIERGIDKANSRDAPGPMPEAIRPVLERLGLDRIRAGFVGGAPSAPELSAFFRAVGVPMLEAYGGTETGLCVFNTIEDFKGGTAGKPLPGVEMKLLDDGEICVRSDMCMVGYRKDPDGTAEAIDADGWLHSGDIGVVDEDGYLKIVDRKREIIINAAAKNMSPANIEQAIKAESSLIGQIVCIGDGRRYNTALITLDPEAAAAAATRHSLESTELEDIVEAPAVVAEVQAAVDRGNAKLSRVETIRKFRIVPDVWVPDTDLLTPTAKVKRRGVDDRYAAEIAALYAE
jgi:long-chain acyl-CoA synthetase